VSRPHIRDLRGHDPYALLGLDRTAERDDIVRAYRQQIRLVHPDRLGGDEDAAKLLHVARDVLLDAQLRQAYDAYRTEPSPPVPAPREPPEPRRPDAVRVSTTVPTPLVGLVVLMAGVTLTLVLCACLAVAALFGWA
jgi:hypothetical protein